MDKCYGNMFRVFLTLKKTIAGFHSSLQSSVVNSVSIITEEKRDERSGENSTCPVAVNAEHNTQQRRNVIKFISF